MNINISENSNLEMIIDNMPMLIIITDEDMIVKYSNIASINMIDRSYYENIERGPGHFISCINSFNSPKGCGYSVNCKKCKLRKLVKETIRTLQPSESIEIQLEILNNNKIEKPCFKVKAIPILKNGDNQIMIVITDVTEYNQMQNEILSSNSFHYSIINYLPEMLWKTDINKNYIYFNKNWEELTVYTVERLFKENRIIGMHPDDI
jgi:transcriptional regulator with PAS, ATPase and Fis domain